MLAALLVGRTVHRKFTVGSVSYEDEIRIDKWSRFVPGQGREGKGIIQFYANGVRNANGLRTIDVSDIVAFIPAVRTSDFRVH